MDIAMVFTSLHPGEGKVIMVEQTPMTVIKTQEEKLKIRSQNEELTSDQVISLLINQACTKTQVNS